MKTRALIALMIIALASGACATSQNQQRSSAMGAAIGAASGAIIGHQFGDGGRDKGALIGAAIGGASGLLYGQQEDSRAQGGGNYGGGYGGYNQQGYSGGDDFRNPYRAPAPQLCRGQWMWDPQSGYWICR